MSAPLQRLLSRPSPTGRAAILGLILAGLGVLLLPWDASHSALPSATSQYLFAVLLTATFAAAEFGQVHFEFRRRALSISLSDLPLVLGLIILPPWLVLLTRLVGALAAIILRRRAFSRAFFNLGLFTSEVGIATAGIYALVDTIDPRLPAVWIPIIATIAVVNLFGMFAVFAAIWWIDEANIAWPTIATTYLSVSASGTLCTALGIMSAIAINLTPYGAGLLVVLFGALLVAHRAYHSLSTRHRILGRLYNFTQSDATGNTTDDVIEILLQQACILLHAESAVLRPQAWAAASVPGDCLREPVVIPRSTRDPEQRAWLTEHALRDAIVLPISQDGSPVGVLQVSNRLGEVGTFGREDVNVLQTLIAHVEVLWHNSALVDKLRRDARHDPLTGLDNRTQMLEHLQRHLSGPTRSSYTEQSLHGGPRPHSGCLLALVDVSFYSSVNDALGQQVADLLLVHVASRLDDGLPDDVLIARVGDDTFAVFVVSCNSAAEATDWVSQIQHCLDQPLETQGMQLDAGPRIGYVLLPEDGVTADIAMQNAHVALVAARRDTRGEGVSRYHSNDSDLSVYRLALAGELRTGIARGEITVIYQPKVSAVNQRVVGFEALARWEHPKHGLIMPDEFIPLADNTGQLGALAASVLEQALDRASEWMLSYPDVGLSVNLSAGQLLDPGLSEMVASLMYRYSIPPQALTLEITESRLMAEPEAAHSAMHELRELGARLSVDDFGTGYSSLSYLQTLPLDEVKIDKSFILPLTRRDQNHAIVRSIIDLVHILGLSVVAEGVETETIRDMLAADGCDVIQGYLIGRGISPESITEWLATWESQISPISLPD